MDRDAIHCSMLYSERLGWVQEEGKMGHLSSEPMTNHLRFRFLSTLKILRMLPLKVPHFIFYSLRYQLNHHLVLIFTKNWSQIHSSWWFQPIWKIWVKLGSSSPIFGMKINNNLKPPASLAYYTYTRNTEPPKMEADGSYSKKNWSQIH